MPRPSKRKRQYYANAAHARNIRQASLKQQVTDSDEYQTENDDSDMEVFDVGSENSNMDSIFVRLQQAMKSQVNDHKRYPIYTGLSKWMLIGMV